MRSIYWLIVVVSCLPLILYPEVLAATHVSVTQGESVHYGPVSAWVAYQVGLWSYVLYPVLLFFCARYAWGRLKRNAPASAILIALVPLVFLIGVVGTCLAIMY